MVGLRHTGIVRYRGFSTTLKRTKEGFKDRFDGNAFIGAPSGSDEATWNTSSAKKKCGNGLSARQCRQSTSAGLFQPFCSSLKLKLETLFSSGK